MNSNMVHNSLIGLASNPCAPHVGEVKKYETKTPLKRQKDESIDDHKCMNPCNQIQTSNNPISNYQA